jgi:hypothetical protein
MGPNVQLNEARATPELSQFYRIWWMLVLAFPAKSALWQSETASVNPANVDIKTRKVVAGRLEILGCLDSGLL